MNEEMTSFPAEISFPIIDDEVALEKAERYSLRLITSDPLIIINQATTEIVILDDDGKLYIHHRQQLELLHLLLHIPVPPFTEIIIGFPYEEIAFEASAVANAKMIVFGEAQQSFVVNFIQGISYSFLYVVTYICCMVCCECSVLFVYRLGKSDCIDI